MQDHRRVIDTAQSSLPSILRSLLEYRTALTFSPQHWQILRGNTHTPFQKDL